jgi:hypothetical protein
MTGVFFINASRAEPGRNSRFGLGFYFAF